MTTSIRSKTFLVRGALVASLAAGALAPAWASPVQEEIAKEIAKETARVKAETDAIIASPLTIPKAAPESAIRVESKGVGDPYPAADRLARENASLYLDGRFEAMQGWRDSSSSSFFWGDPDPKFDKLLALWENDARTCVPIKAHLPGVEILSDVHDFVVPLKELQAYLALQGILFAPFGMRNWETVRFSAHFEGDLYRPQLHRQEHVKTTAQGFWRIVPFVTTGTPEQVTKAIVKLAAQRGYEDITPRNLPGWVGGYHGSLLTQIVTPNVSNGALLAVSEHDDTDPISIKDIHCLVTDDFGRSWLYKKANPKTGREYSMRDLSSGYILQTSIIPLGKETEYFTNAHVDERLARERKMTPAQVAAERDALAARSYREAAKKAPNHQRDLAEQRDLAKESEKTARQFKRDFPDRLRAILLKAGYSRAVVDAWSNLYRQVADLWERTSREVAEWYQKWLQSIWQ